ncbi:hypothetical protein [Microbispora hainanensis]|uniref:Uncharacterized protein n=1 Tax=Microbispora hainanensis TaxID=568844 RepID=A0A544YZV8_9ACTN|nr:hypothetical protein [Microbispora hainanensis]TQS22326.1 hypothetical protein FLX08_07970 [Microbispora hainanensis]
MSERDDERGLLEERYRRWLRLLPASYRAEREEEMVAAFMDGARRAPAGHDDQRPRLLEIASVAALALRLRLGGPGSPPGAYLWGETVRLAALLGLVFWTTIAGLYAGQAVLTYGIPADALPDGVMGIGDPESPDRARLVLADLTPLLWAVSLGALARGRARTAKAAAVAALVVPCVLVPPPMTEWENAVRWACSLLPAVVPALALLTGFHRAAPPPRLPARRARLLLALPVAAGLLLSLVVGVLGAATRAATRAGIPSEELLVAAWMWADTTGLASVSLAAVAVWCALRHRTPGRSAGPVALAAAILAVPAVLARAGTMPGMTGVTFLTATLQLAVLVASGIALVVIGVRALRAADPGLTALRAP